MKKITTSIIFCCYLFSISAQSWGENGFLYKTWFDKYPDHIKGFRTMTVEKWQSNAWVNSYRQRVLQADAQLSPLSIETDLWVAANNAFRPDWRLTYQNTPSGQPRGLRTQRYSTSTMLWQEGYRDSLIYRPDGLLLTDTYFERQNNGSYLPISRDSLAYNAQTRLLFNYHQMAGILVATGELVWGTDNRDSLVYDAQGRLAIYYQQPVVGSRFVELQRNSYKYDAQGRYQTFIREGFNGSIWDTMFRHNFIYTGNQLSQILREQYILSGRVFLPHSRISFQYDAQGRVTQELMESLAAGNWQGTTRTTFAYTPLSIEPNFLPDASVQLSPNPCSTGQLLTIHLTDKQESLHRVNIYDMLGRQIFKQTNDGSDPQTVTIATQNFEKGYYLIKIETASGRRFLTKKWLVI
jgi:hypothetical protein